MTPQDLMVVEQICVDVVSSVIADYRPQLLDAALTGKARERRNDRHADNFLSDFDIALHEHYRAMLTERLKDFVYLSEEGKPEIVGSSPRLAILVDPLDTSELAVRGLNGYTHLLAYSLSEARPVVAVVGDFYHEIDLYLGSACGERPRAAVRTRGTAFRPMVAPRRQPADRLLATSYNMRPAERFAPLAEQFRLMALLTEGTGDHRGAEGPKGDWSRIGVDFGSVGFCHVATGASDVFLEFAKGFALWDLLPGQFILGCAGGAVHSLDGEPLPWPTSAFEDINSMQSAMDVRQTFVAAGTPEVARLVADVID